MTWELTSVEQLDGLRARVGFESDAWRGWRISVVSGVALEMAGPRPYVESLTISSADRKPAPQLLIEKLRVGHLYSAAMDAAEQLDLEAVDDRPPLPPGQPRKNANNDAWYRDFGRTVDGWRWLGMKVADIDEEIARRRGVKDETVKRWRRSAKQIAERDAEQRPAAVASCAACGGPILPGAVGAVEGAEGEWSLFHPFGCTEKGYDRMVITADGEVVPL